jgi:hypothetical protein
VLIQSPRKQPWHECSDDGCTKSVHNSGVCLRHGAGRMHAAAKGAQIMSRILNIDLVNYSK